MKIVLLVEGETETSLPNFFKSWLDPQLEQSIGITVRRFSGVGDYRRDFAKRARLLLDTPEIVGVVGLIDFYGSGLSYPPGTISEKCRWAKQLLENQVNHSRFRQHFAVHETEAWLFAQPEIFPKAIAEVLPRNAAPESINTNHPPGSRLRELYPKYIGKKYGKPIEGSRLFEKLDPAIASEKCPHLKLLLDDLLELAKG